MTVELFTAFTVTQILMSLTPGPAVLLVSSQAMARGFLAGLLAALGVLAGNTIYFTLSVAGLGAILATSVLLFSLLKWAGAAYLVWLGVGAIRNARRTAENPESLPPVSLWQGPFAQGLVKQLANPKAVLFFGALLPQFVTPTGAETWSVALLLVTMHATELPILCGYAWIASRGGALLRSPGGILWRERAAGAAQIAVGGFLATLRRVA